MTAASSVLPFSHAGQIGAFQEWRDRGFANLLPITPPGCLLAERSSLAATLRGGRDNRGKAPGVKGVDGRWRGVDWLHLQTTLENVQAWGAMGAGVGLRLGDGLGAVDFDIVDEKLCIKILRRFCELVRHDHKIRTGREPKFLILVRIEGDVPYKRVEFANGQRVEFLGRGRQCVLAGIHPGTGRPYFWHGNETPSFAELAVITVEVLDRFFAELATWPEAASRVISESRATGAFPDQSTLIGKLNDVRRAIEALPNTTAAFPLRDDYVRVGIAIKAALPDHPQEAFELYEGWCGRWIDPPPGGGNDGDVVEGDWSRMHAPFKIGAGWLYRKAEELGGFDRPSVFFGPLPPDVPTVSGEPWAAPVDIFGDGADGPPLELAPDILPPVLGRAAADMAERIGVPLAFTGGAVLATASAAIGAKLRIQPRQLDTSWTQPAFLWIGLVEDPGGKKSPVISAATLPLRALNDRTSREGARAVAEWKQRQRRKDASVETKPAVVRYVADGFTIEALSQILAENPQGVLISPDELSGLLTSLDAYKTTKGNDRAALLRLFEGSGLQIDRVGTGLTHIESWGASVLGGIQPKRIAGLAGNLEEDGLLQRFLPIVGDGRRRPDVDREPDDQAARDYFEAITSIAAARYFVPQPIRLSPPAAAIIRDLWQRVDRLAALPDMSDAWRGHLGKWRGIAARLFLIFHVYDTFPLFEGDCERLPITDDTACRAARCADFLLAHAMRFYSQCVGLGDVGERARWIAGHLLARHQGEAKITRRQISVARHELRDEAAKVVAAMRFLEFANWVRSDFSNLDRQNNPQAWFINPAIFACFHARAEIEKKRRLEIQDRIAAAANERRRIFQADA